MEKGNLYNSNRFNWWGGKKNPKTFWGDEVALSQMRGHKMIKGQSLDSLTKVDVFVGSSKFE